MCIIASSIETAGKVQGRHVTGVYLEHQKPFASLVDIVEQALHTPRLHNHLTSGKTASETCTVTHVVCQSELDKDT